MLLVAGPCAAKNLSVSGQAYRVGSWAVQAKIDPISDKPWVIVQTPLDSRVGPYLKLSCEKGSPYISFGVPGVTFKTDETVSVSLRIDKGEVKRFRFVAVDDILGATLPRATYERLSKSNFIAAFIERDDGNNWTLEVPVRKTAEAFKPMLAACPMETAATESSGNNDADKLGADGHTGPNPAIKIGSWDVLKFKDAVTDDPDIRLVAADRTNSGATFAVLCQYKTPMVSFDFPKMRFSEHRMVDVIWRINAALPAATKFTSVANSGMVVARILKSTYQRLSTATSVAIKINTGIGETFTTEFLLKKTPEAFLNIFTACPMSSAGDDPSP